MVMCRNEAKLNDSVIKLLSNTTVHSDRYNHKTKYEANKQLIRKCIACQESQFEKYLIGCKM